MLTHRLNIKVIEGISSENRLRVAFLPAYDVSKKGQSDQFERHYSALPTIITHPKDPLQILLFFKRDFVSGKFIPTVFTSAEAVPWSSNEYELQIEWEAPKQSITGWYTLEAWENEEWRPVANFLHELKRDRKRATSVPVYSVLGEPRELRVSALPKLFDFGPGMLRGSQAFSVKAYIEGRGAWDVREISYFRQEMEKVDVMFHVSDVSKIDWRNLFYPITSRIEASLQDMALLVLLEMAGREIFPPVASKGPIDPLADDIYRIIDQSRDYVAEANSVVKEFTQLVKEEKEKLKSSKKQSDERVALEKELQDIEKESNAVGEEGRTALEERRAAIENQLREFELESEAQLEFVRDAERELDQAVKMQSYVRGLYDTSKANYEHAVLNDVSSDDFQSRKDIIIGYAKQMDDELRAFRSSLSSPDKFDDAISKKDISFVTPPKQPKDVPSAFDEFVSRGAWPSYMIERLSVHTGKDSLWIVPKNLSELEDIVRQIVSAKTNDFASQEKTIQRVALQIREAISLITESGSFMRESLGSNNSFTLPASFVTARTRIEFQDNFAISPQVCYVSLCNDVEGFTETSKDQLNLPVRRANPIRLPGVTARWYFAKLPKEFSEEKLERKVNRAFNKKILVSSATAPTGSESGEVDSSSEEDSGELFSPTDEDENDPFGFPDLPSDEEAPSEIESGDEDDPYAASSSVRNPPTSINEKIGSKNTERDDEGTRYLALPYIPRKRKNAGVYIAVSSQLHQVGYSGKARIPTFRAPIYAVRYYTWEEGVIDLGEYRLGDSVTMDGTPLIEKGEEPYWTPMYGALLHQQSPPFLRLLYQAADTGEYANRQKSLTLRVASRRDPTDWLLRFRKNNESTMRFRWNIARPTENEKIAFPVQRNVREFVKFHGFDDTEDGLLDFQYDMPRIYDYALSLDTLCNYYGSGNQFNFSLVKEDLRCWIDVDERWAPPYLRFTPDPRLLPDLERQFVLFNPLYGNWVLFSVPETTKPLLEIVKELNIFGSQDKAHAEALLVWKTETTISFRNGVRNYLAQNGYLADETGLPGGREAIRLITLMNFVAPAPLLPKVLGPTLNDSFVLWVQRSPEMRETLANSPHYSSLMNVPLELLFQWILDWIDRYEATDSIKYADRVEEFRSVWLQMSSRFDHFVALAAMTPEHALSLSHSHIHSTHRAAWKPYLQRLTQTDRELLSSPASLQNTKKFDPQAWRFAASIREIQDLRDFLLPLGTFQGFDEESPGDFSSAETQVRAARKLFEIRVRQRFGSNEDRLFRENVVNAYSKTLSTNLLKVNGKMNATSADLRDRIVGPLYVTDWKIAVANYSAQLTANGTGVQAVSPYTPTPILRGVLAPSEKLPLPASFGVARADISIAKWLEDVQKEEEEVETKAKVPIPTPIVVVVPPVVAPPVTVLPAILNTPIDYVNAIRSPEVKALSWNDFVNQVARPYSKEIYEKAQAAAENFGPYGEHALFLDVAMRVADPAENSEDVKKMRVDFSKFSDPSGEAFKRFQQLSTEDPPKWRLPSLILDLETVSRALDEFSKSAPKGKGRLKRKGKGGGLASSSARRAKPQSSDVTPSFRFKNSRDYADRLTDSLADGYSVSEFVQKLMDPYMLDVMELGRKNGEMIPSEFENQYTASVDALKKGISPRATAEERQNAIEQVNSLLNPDGDVSRFVKDLLMYKQWKYSLALALQILARKTQAELEKIRKEEEALAQASSSTASSSQSSGTFETAESPSSQSSATLSKPTEEPVLEQAQTKTDASSSKFEYETPEEYVNSLRAHSLDDRSAVEFIGIMVTPYYSEVLRRAQQEGVEGFDATEETTVKVIRDALKISSTKSRDPENDAIAKSLELPEAIIKFLQNPLNSENTPWTYAYAAMVEKVSTRAREAYFNIGKAEAASSSSSQATLTKPNETPGLEQAQTKIEATSDFQYDTPESYLRSLDATIEDAKLSPDFIKIMVEPYFLEVSRRAKLEDPSLVPEESNVSKSFRNLLIFSAAKNRDTKIDGFAENLEDAHEKVKDDLSTLSEERPRTWRYAYLKVLDKTIDKMLRDYYNKSYVEAASSSESVELVPLDLAIDPKIVSEFADGTTQTLGELVPPKPQRLINLLIGARYEPLQPTTSIWINSANTPDYFQANPRNVLESLFGQTFFFTKEELSFEQLQSMVLETTKDGSAFKAELCTNCVYRYNKGADSGSLVILPYNDFPKHFSSINKVADRFCLTVGGLDESLWDADTYPIEALKPPGSLDQYKLVFLGVDTEKTAHVLIIPGVSTIADQSTQQYLPYYKIPGANLSEARAASRALKCPPLLNPFLHNTEDITGRLVFSNSDLSSIIKVSPNSYTKVASEISGRSVRFDLYRLTKSGNIKTFHGLKNETTGLSIEDLDVSSTDHVLVGYITNLREQKDVAIPEKMNDYLRKNDIEPARYDFEFAEKKSVGVPDRSMWVRNELSMPLQSRGAYPISSEIELDTQ